MTDFLPLSCPWCLIHEEIDVFKNGLIGISEFGTQPRYYYYYAWCVRCGLNGPIVKTKREAAKAWKRITIKEFNPTE